MFSENITNHIKADSKLGFKDTNNSPTLLEAVEAFKSRSNLIYLGMGGIGGVGVGGGVTPKAASKL